MVSGFAKSRSRINAPNVRRNMVPDLWTGGTKYQKQLKMTENNQKLPKTTENTERIFFG